MDEDAHLKLSTDYALSGAKGVFVANGSAIISLLTFAGNEQKIADELALRWSFVWFSLGVIFALSAHLFGFLSHATHMNGTSHYSRGECFAWLGLSTAIFGIVFFIAGSFVALDALFDYV